VSRTNQVALFVFGLCLSTAAIAQDVILEPPTHGPNYLNNLGAFKRVLLTTSAILDSVTALNNVPSLIQTDLVATNTLLEQTQVSLDGLGVTSALLATSVTHDLGADVESVEFALDDYVTECSDEEYTCSGSIRTVTVDGQSAPFSCYPYRCGFSGDCVNSCASDFDCSGGTHCNAAGACAPYAAPTCEYAPGQEGNRPWQIYVKDGADQVSDCTPYICDDGACRDACSATDHCRAGFVCDTSKALCVVPPPPPPPDDDIF